MPCGVSEDQRGNALFGDDGPTAILCVRRVRQCIPHTSPVEEYLNRGALSASE